MPLEQAPPTPPPWSGPEGGSERRSLSDRERERGLLGVAQPPHFPLENGIVNKVVVGVNDGAVRGRRSEGGIANRARELQKGASKGPAWLRTWLQPFPALSDALRERRAKAVRDILVRVAGPLATFSSRRAIGGREGKAYPLASLSTVCRAGVAPLLCAHSSTLGPQLWGLGRTLVLEDTLGRNLFRVRHFPQNFGGWIGGPCPILLPSWALRYQGS